MTDVVCEECGHRNPAGANYCSSCGSPLSGARDDRTATFRVSDLSDLVIDPTDDAVVVERTEVPAGAAALVVKSGQQLGERHVLSGDRITAGRHPRSDIFLNDVTVSRRHVEIERTPEGYRLRDVGSLNGTYVNRNRIDEVILQDGDEIQIGKFKLVFVSGVPR